MQKGLAQGNSKRQSWIQTQVRLPPEPKFFTLVLPCLMIAISQMRTLRPTAGKELP